MQTLPKWIVSGAFILALNAGVINAVGILGFTHKAVSHVSGNATSLGLSLPHFSNTPSATFELLLIIVAFLIGATISGWLLKSSKAKLGRHYDTLLLIEAVILLTAACLFHYEVVGGHYLASMACGLQNAMVTTYSGAIVRTTHLTGIVTDLGLMLGARLRGEPIETRKARLFIAIFVGFVLGGTLAAWLFSALSFWTLGIMAVVCLLLACIYRYFLVMPASADAY
jgi:uncharacterized membrane protein YoaK (UPF0700 family)